MTKPSPTRQDHVEELADLLARLTRYPNFARDPGGAGDHPVIATLKRALAGIGAADVVDAFAAKRLKARLDLDYEHKRERARQLFETLEKEAPPYPLP